MTPRRFVDSEGFQRLLLTVLFVNYLAVVGSAQAGLRSFLAAICAIACAWLIHRWRHQGELKREWQALETRMTARCLSIAEAHGGRITYARLVQRLMTEVPDCGLDAIDRVLQVLEVRGVVDRPTNDLTLEAEIVFRGLGPEAVRSSELPRSGV